MLPPPKVVGWSAVPAVGWNLLASRTFFDDGMLFVTNAIYSTPTFRRKNFPSNPDTNINYSLLFQPSFLHMETLNIFSHV